MVFCIELGCGGHGSCDLDFALVPKYFSGESHSSVGSVIFSDFGFLGRKIFYYSVEDRSLVKVPDMEVIDYGWFKEKEGDQEKGNTPVENQEGA